MANDNYNDLVKTAREYAGRRGYAELPIAVQIVLNKLADAVEQLQKERDDLRPDAEATRQIDRKAEQLESEVAAAYHFGLPQSFAGSLNAQLRRAEQRITALREALSRYLAFSDADYVSALQEVVDIGQIARAALARDDEAAKKQDG